VGDTAKEASHSTNTHTVTSVILQSK